jgi:MFS family permease
VFPILLSYVNVRRAFQGHPSVNKFLSSIAVGGGAGMLLTPYMTDFFLKEFGWRGTFMMAGGIFFHLLLIGVAIELNSPPSEGSTSSKGFDWKKQTAIFKFKFRAFSILVFDNSLFGMFGNLSVFSSFVIITT